MGVTKVLLTLLKLAISLAILAFGWMVWSPVATAHWPLSAPVQAVAGRLTALLPVERPAWALVILLLGAASLLAALPMPVKARSRNRPPAATAPDAPVAESASPEVIEAPAAFDVLQHDTAPEAAALAAPPAPADTPPTMVVEEPAPSPVETATVAAPPSLDEEEQGARRALARGDTAEARSHLADLLKKRGDIAESEGRLDAAITAYEESVRLRRAALVGQPDSAREQRWLWTTLESLAECREDRGHRSRAAALFREAASAGIRAVALAPGEVHYPAELNETRARLAAIEAQLAL